MKEITVISGKGGTGKSSLTRAFVDLAKKSLVVCDLDVDAANMHLVLKHQVQLRQGFISGKGYAIDESKCMQCGLCYEKCRFAAIVNDGGYKIDSFACEACGVCAYLCPAEAIKNCDKVCGDIYEASYSESSTFIYAHLRTGEENSGKLVSRVRRLGKEAAEKSKADFQLNDGPPGIGCPVIASITGVDAALIITEPTPSGYEDMGRVGELLEHFKIPGFVAVNRSDINTEMTAKIKTMTEALNLFWCGKIDYDRGFTKAQSLCESALGHVKEKTALQIRAVWEVVMKKMLETNYAKRR